MDTFVGLPAHPLIVHAAVVLTPLAAVALVLYVVIPSWRTGLKWPLLAVALGGAVSGWMAEESGEALQKRLRDLGNKSPLINEHIDAAELATKAGLLVLVVAAVTVFFLAKPSGDDAQPRRMLALALALVAGGIATYLVVVAGHSGATAVWDGTIQ